MRSLNTSLPTSSPRRRDPPEQLLQAFRSAALSVTTLYKTAASDQANSHQAGYQEALDDLLTFLDHENLGLGDGEGWRVRQWATERLDGTQASGESDDEKADVEARVRSTSPNITRKEHHHTEPDTTQVEARPASPIRIIPAPSSSSSASSAPLTHPPSSEAFTFRSSVAYPHYRDMEMNGGTDADASSPISASRTPPATSHPDRTAPGSSHRGDGSSRGSRHRVGGASNRMTTRSSTSIGALGNGAGQKRRLHFGDFFDLGSSNGNGKDGFGGSGGGKRGRFL